MNLEQQVQNVQVALAQIAKDVADVKAGNVAQFPIDIEDTVMHLKAVVDMQQSLEARLLSIEKYLTSQGVQL